MLIRLFATTTGEYLVHNGIRTFACSETQKFGHVTYFWNGNRSGYFNEQLETYYKIESDNCVFNTAPRMKADEITEAAIQARPPSSFLFFFCFCFSCCSVRVGWDRNNRDDIIFFKVR